MVIHEGIYHMRVCIKCILDEFVRSIETMIPDFPIQRTKGKLMHNHWPLAEVAVGRKSDKLGIRAMTMPATQLENG
jgi:hypothetical protein